MKQFILLPLTLTLFACGGGDSEADNAALTPNVPQQGKQAIDCSPNKDNALSIPLPEYPGNYSAYDEPEGGGFDPQSFVELARLGLILGIARSEEGMSHNGPVWEIIDGALTIKIQYKIKDSKEIWSILKNGIDSDDNQYTDHTDLEVEQTASCGLNIRNYDENGSLESNYVSSTYAWSLDAYEDGNKTGQILTTINQDRSGKTTSEDFESQSDYPVTIIEWDSNGDNVLIKSCETTLGINCASAVAQ